MSSNTANVLNKITEDEEKDVISQEYEKLNKKCDTVITKIKKRKQKSKKSN